MNRWLNGFSYSIKIALWVYLLAIVLTLIIALLVILIQVVKTGRMNPVEALKYE
jgi:putative ABC transport system permease protein